MNLSTEAQRDLVLIAEFYRAGQLVFVSERRPEVTPLLPEQESPFHAEAPGRDLHCRVLFKYLSGAPVKSR